MTRRKISFDTVRDMGLALSDVEDGTTYGSLALKVRGKMFACLAIHRSAEPDSLVVRIGFDQRQELITADPAIYYITDHYLNYPVMLVRLARVHPDALRDLLSMAWRFTSSRRNRAGSPRARARPRRRK